MYCTNCGEEQLTKARYCPACGTLVERGLAVPSPTPERPDDASWVTSPSAEPRRPDRRRFLRLAAGATASVGLLGAGGLALHHRHRAGRAEAKPASEALSRFRSLLDPPELELEPPSIAAFYEPRLDRVHSLSSYQAVAARSAPLEVIERITEDAIVAADLRAVERDLIFDDIVPRESKLVLMGEHGGWFIGFTYRYIVDMTYPARALESDGAGLPEWGRHRLTVLDATYTLKQLREGQRPEHVGHDIAWYEPVGDHDAAIVYFPSSRPFAARPQLGVEDAPKLIREALSSSSSLFGLDYVLLSPQSLNRMRSELEARAMRMPLFVAGLAVAALVFLPLFGSINGAGLLSKAALSPAGRKLLARSLPTAFRLGRDLLVREDGFALRPLGDVALSLLGVDFPRDDADARAMLDKFLAALAERDDAARFVDFTDPGEARVGQVFLPDSRLCLAGELLSRGLVRLDTQRVEVLREYPELVGLALAAVESKQNLAERWAEDRDYVAELRALNRVVTG